ncbi:MAG: hypothetical protein ACRC0G_03400 [Fusobacteriaceae bacterium]
MAKTLSVKIVDGVPCLSCLVGERFVFNGKNIRVCESNILNSSIKLAIDCYGNGADEKTEEVSMCLGTDRFVQMMEDNYGVIVNFVDTFSYSQEAITKASGLVLAGFEKITMVNGIYFVDGIFEQSFLREEELQYLLSNDFQDVLLLDIQ